MNLYLLFLGLKLLNIVVKRILIPRLWHHLVRADVRNWMITFWIVDLGLVIGIYFNRLLKKLGPISLVIHCTNGAILWPTEVSDRM